MYWICNLYEISARLCSTSRNIHRLCKHTAFSFACLEGHTDIVKMLLEEPSLEINRNDKFGQTGFYHACANSYVDIVKMLLNDDRIVINVMNMVGLYPLHSAYGKSSVLELLTASEKINPNQTTYFGNTLLHTACSNSGGYATVEILIGCERIDINKLDKNGRTAFHLDCKNGHIDIINLMLEKCDNVIIPTEKFSDIVEEILNKHR